ncbi:MAG: hypothetical protein IPO69_00065 [Saprospiraceae bacterium]|nr:hypothetical protein [Saprospiraceae bacterium]
MKSKPLYTCNFDGLSTKSPYARILQRHRNKTLHLLFWSVYFSFFFYQISNSGRSRAEDQPFLQLFNNALSHTIYLMIVAYLNYFLIMPRFLRHKNGIRYTVEFVSMAVVILFFIRTR